MVVRYIALFLFLCSCSSQEKAHIEPSFSDSIEKNSIDWQFITDHPGNRSRVENIETLYEAHRPSKLVPEKEGKIPKIIHHIWLGPKPKPSYFSHYLSTWKKNHPDWTFMLWTDKEAEALDFELKELYLDTKNYGERSDILRAEILDQFGGIYVDVDIENIKPFDALVERYDFFAGLEPPHQGDFTSQAPHIVISNALIGSVKGHPTLKCWKQKILERWSRYKEQFPDSAKRVLLRTFYPFGDAVDETLQSDSFTNIVFPPSYFFPLTFIHVYKGKPKTENFFKKKSREIRRFLTGAKKGPFSEIKPETMAVHYWGNNWLTSSEERLREMYRHVMHVEETLTAKIERLESKIEAMGNSQVDKKK